jgi:hypothetical protein
VDHSSGGHHGIIVPVAASKHSSDGQDEVMMPVSTRKHSSDGPMMS